MTVAAAILVILPLSLAMIAICDLLWLTIPNRIAAILLASFLGLAPFAGLAWPTIGLHFLTGFAVLVAGFGLFAAKLLGGGDAKALAACAVWLGPTSSLAAFLAGVAAIGGLLSLAAIVVRTPSPLAAVLRAVLPAHLGDPDAGIPYGVAIGIAGLLACPQSALMRHALTVAAA